MEENYLRNRDGAPEESDEQVTQATMQEHDVLDEVITREDAVELLQHDMRAWPRLEREVFELYYVEGMDPEEILMVTGYPLAAVEGGLASVRKKLIEQLHEKEIAA